MRLDHFVQSPLLSLTSESRVVLMLSCRTNEYSPNIHDDDMMFTVVMTQALSQRARTNKMAFWNPFRRVLLLLLLAKAATIGSTEAHKESYSPQNSKSPPYHVA